MSQVSTKSGAAAAPGTSLEEVMARLQTSRDGLTSQEAQHRLARDGSNELPEKEVNPLLKFLSYFWGPIPWMIESALLLSAYVRDWPDFAIIFVLLVLNSVIGFWEEYSAGNAIAALKAQLALAATVKRDGRWISIPARELAAGDIILLKIGDVLPADARLLEGDPAEVDQAALTGESLPVTRATGEEVYSGSVLKRGRIEAVVTATGPRTFFGKTARLVEEAQTTSHFQKAVLKIGDFLIVAAVILVCIILIAKLFQGTDPFLQVLKFCLVLTIASIPVAMPTVLSVTMAVGARTLARMKAVVTRLASIEEMAGIDILCSDKTGTLTQNKLSLGDPFTVAGVSADEAVLMAALASRAEDRDAIDLTIIGSLKDTARREKYTVVHFTPFDPVSKRAEAEVRGPDGTTVKVTKGAPQVILALAANRPLIEAAVNQAIEEFAHRGYRSLGVARTDEQGQWQLLGVLPLFDPPRPDSQQTIQDAAQLGVPVKMVTGDQVAIARETCRQLGLGQDIVDAAALRQASAAELDRMGERIKAADGFAQVFPEDKFNIVKELQKRGHIVGMTGDGVNDAPALKEADAGIAVSGATDAARAAADIVLLSTGLSVIVEAIKLSREIFERMNSYVMYRMAETIRIIAFMTLSILVFNFYPVTAVMIVLLAILNDGAILTIAVDNTKPANRPVAWNMPVVLGMATVLGTAGVLASFVLFYLGEVVWKLDRPMIQTLIYLKLSVAGHMTMFVTRTRGPFWSIKPAPALLGAIVGTQIVATLIAVYGVGLVTPIGWRWAAVVWGYALAWFLVNDRIKLGAYRIFDRRQALLGSRHLKRWQALGGD